MLKPTVGKLTFQHSTGVWMCALHITTVLYLYRAIVMKNTQAILTFTNTTNSYPYEDMTGTVHRVRQKQQRNQWSWLLPHQTLSVCRQTSSVSATSTTIQETDWILELPPHKSNIVISFYQKGSARPTLGYIDANKIWTHDTWNSSLYLLYIYRAITSHGTFVMLIHLTGSNHNSIKHIKL